MLGNLRVERLGEVAHEFGHDPGDLGGNSVGCIDHGPAEIVEHQGRTLSSQNGSGGTYEIPSCKTEHFLEEGSVEDETDVALFKIPAAVGPIDNLVDDPH